MIPLPTELVSTLERLASNGWTGTMKLDWKDGHIVHWEKPKRARSEKANENR